MTDSDIPIDIHYNKLLEWLISRRHCSHDWQKSVLIIREKINEAIQDMPPLDEIKQLLQGGFINYFHCIRIVELLKETESSSKNIFGSYSSQRMKDWLEITKLYEQDGVYLAEAAQLLSRNVNYEIPTLQRQKSKFQQALSDSIRKENEYAGSSNDLFTKYSKSCKQMGIEGKKLKAEITALVKDLPLKYKEIGKNISNLSSCITYYSDFVSFLLQNKNFEDNCLPLLKYIVKHGDVTLYQWRVGEIPERVETIEFEVEDDKEVEDENEIDWGVIDSSEFNISQNNDEGEIDFGTDDGEIDWGISDSIDIEIVDNNLEEIGVAKGNDALTLLDNKETRTKVINELLELESFLIGRINDVEGDDNNVLSHQMQLAPLNVQIDSNVISEMLVQVKEVINQFMESKMAELILIRSSPKYIERVISKLKTYLEDSEKMLLRSKLMVKSREDISNEIEALEPKIKILQEKTKELQKQISGEISMKYHNRPVNIMGEINKI